jgi:hypothetical protein
MNALEDINNLEYNVYENLWGEFWVQKLGYNPAGEKGTLTIKSIVQTRKEDKELAKEFVNFYTNKVNK